MNVHELTRPRVTIDEAVSARQVGLLQGEALLQGLGERKVEGPYDIELIAAHPTTPTRRRSSRAP